MVLLTPQMVKLVMMEEIMGGHYCDTDCTIKDNFVSVWTIPSDGKTLTLTLPNTVTSYSTDSSCNNSSSSTVLSYNFVIDWGDSTPISEVTSYNDADLSHTYLTEGEYTVTITGTMEGLQLGSDSVNALKLKSVPNLGNVGWKSLYQGFRGAENLESLRGGDISGVLNLSYAFFIVRNADLQIFEWDTSSVTTLNRIFAGGWDITADVSNWDVSNVTDMSNAFSSVIAMQPLLSSWNVANVTDMSYMFYRSKLGGH